MERMTHRYRNGIPYYVVDQRESIIGRLASIEDILGDTYDLDHLRELVEADQEGRCVVHGEWSRHGFYEDCDLRDTCSTCGTSFYEHLKVKRIPVKHYHGCGWRYCPHCGARMDGGKHDG